MLIKTYGPLVVPVDTVYQIMRLEDRKRALESVVNRIDQTRILCQGRPELLKIALGELYPKFTQHAAAYQSFVIQMGGTAQDVENEINQCVSIQDAILAALAGDKGAALDALEWRGDLTFDYQPDLGGRPAGMSEERQWLAKEARNWRKLKKRQWWVVGKHILDLLHHKKQRDSNEEWAYQRLMEFSAVGDDGNPYIVEKQAFAKFIRQLVDDFRKLDVG